MNRKFRMIDSGSCDGPAQHWVGAPFSTLPMRVTDENGHAFVDIMVGGEDMEAQIDLSSPDTIMNLDIAERRLDVDPEEQGFEELGELQSGSR